MLVVSLTVDELSVLIESTVQKVLREILPEPPVKYLTAIEASKRLGISRATLLKYVKQGTIKQCLLGSVRRYRESEIEVAYTTLQDIKRQKFK